MPSERFRLKFTIREATAGAHLIALEPVGEGFAQALDCESLHFLLRDGVSDATLEALVRELNGCVELLSVQKP